MRTCESGNIFIIQLSPAPRQVVAKMPSNDAHEVDSTVPSAARDEEKLSKRLLDIISCSEKTAWKPAYRSPESQHSWLGTEYLG